MNIFGVFSYKNTLAIDLDQAPDQQSANMIEKI
jgi:hypothetical protein